MVAPEGWLAADTTSDPNKEHPVAFQPWVNPFRSGYLVHKSHILFFRTKLFHMQMFLYIYNTW